MALNIATCFPSSKGKRRAALPRLLVPLAEFPFLAGPFRFVGLAPLEAAFLAADFLALR